jgi:hypothetical protein
MAVGEWDQRQLCPDGACVGVIGPDGTCKVCGRAAPNWGDERKRGLLDPPEEDDEDAADDGAAMAGADEGDADEDDDKQDEDEDEEDEDEEDDDDARDDEGDEDRGGRPVSAAPVAEWGSRRLCADGGCIGVLGQDGRCKVCGRRPEEVAAGQSSSGVPDATTGEDRDGPGSSS